MKQRLLQQIATATKILKLKTGYAESSLKRSATLILNNKAKASAGAVRLAQKFRSSLTSTESKTKSVNNLNKNANIQNRRLASKLDITESTIQHDKVSVFKTLNRFRQRILLFDLVMGAFRNTWWAKPLLIAYIIISYLFSAVLLARLAFLIEILQLDFWGIVDYFKNMDLDSVEGVYIDWNPVPKEPMAPTLGLPGIPIEDNPFAGTFIQQVDPKEFALEQFNHARYLAEKAYLKAAKVASHLPDVLDSSNYTKALQGLNDAYYQAVNSYGSLSDFRRALGIYTGIKGWFNSWIGYPLYDALTWAFSINPYILMAALTGLLLFNPVNVFSIVMYFPLKLLSFPVDLAHWFMLNYVDTFIIAMNNKLHYIGTKTGISELFKWMDGREMDGDNIEEALRYHNNQMAGLKTDPTMLNTDTQGQGIIRTSVIDYVKDLGEYPEDVLDKGKGPEGGAGTSLTDFLKDWFRTPTAPEQITAETPTVTVTLVENNTTASSSAGPAADSNAPSAPINTPSPVNATSSTGTATARVLSRAGSGAATPRVAASAAVGLAVALETEATEEVLAAATQKLQDAEVPSENPRVQLSSQYLSAKARLDAATPPLSDPVDEEGSGSEGSDDEGSEESDSEETVTAKD